LQDTPRYPIRAVSKLTGVPVDTLRAWERRYAVVEPARDPRGRLYSDADVHKLRLLKTLVERGHAIGRLAALDDGALAALGADVPAPSRSAAPDGTGGGVDLERLYAAFVRFDAAAAERELSRLAALLSPRTLVREVALPLMARVGEGWERGELDAAQEHLVSAALRSLLGALVRLHGHEGARVAILFATPPGERHEFGILAAAMLAAGGGLRAVYLGADLPPGEIAAAARRAGARAVVLGVSGAASADAAADAIAAVARDLPRGVELWTGGPPRPEVEAAVAAARGTHLPDFDAYEARLAGLGARL
jgi:MerR family transcriptional regulator, light-induced transcriptional regulator